MSNPKIILTSFTPFDSPGGVPRFNRDFASAFPKGTVKHYSWFDVVKDVGKDYNIPEWEKAKFLAKWLIQKKRVTKEDIVIADGFWADGYEPTRTVSVSHGEWSHTTYTDVIQGIPPEFPQHHEAQVAFRRRFSGTGGKLVACSEFVAYQCKIQWNFDMAVINNGIDLKKFRPRQLYIPRKRPIIIHGTTTVCKGYEHIDAIKQNVDADVLLLDDAADYFKLPKYEAMAQADLIVHPSAYEGNSYFLLESLASNIPIVSYDVGLMWSAKRNGAKIGLILDRCDRKPEVTLAGVKSILSGRTEVSPREYAFQFSLENFQQNWRNYLNKEFDCTY